MVHGFAPQGLGCLPTLVQPGVGIARLTDLMAAPLVGSGCTGCWQFPIFKIQLTKQKNSRLITKP